MAALEAERFDFDGPTDLAGQHVPPPWLSMAQYYGGPEGGIPTVVAGRGIGGSQALEARYGVNELEQPVGGAIYVLPRPLTQADGAVRISVMFFPQPSVHDPQDPGTRYWAHCGALTIGSGKGPDANYQTIRFEATYDHRFVDTPQQFIIGAWRGAGGIEGGSLGTFTPAGGFYQLIFDFNPEWTEITNTVIAPDGGVRSVTQPHWTPVPIEWVSLDVGPMPLIGIGPATYDNLQLPDIAVRIAGQPRDQTARPGWNVTLASTVDGTHPRFIQWHHAGVPLPEGTNASLTLPAVQPEHGGQYHFVLSNSFSAVTSRVATLYVTNPPLPEAGTVVAWGESEAIRTQLPSGLQAVAVAVGLAHALALKPDGTVIAWGDDNFGQMADMPTDLTDVVGIATGALHSLALRRDGLATGWPSNAMNGATQIPPDLTNLLAVAAGYAHSIVLRGDHTVGAWILGSFPPEEIEDVIQLATGNSHVLALTRAGTVVAWGDNAYGQTSVPPDLADVTAIAAGADHSLALKRDGTVVSWGTLSAVPPDLANVVAIAAGAAHNLVLKADGTVVAWGDNCCGQTTIPPGLKRVLAIAAYGNNNVVTMRGSIERPPAPRLTIVSWLGGVAELQIASEPGWPCQIESSADLVAWTPIETQTPSQSPWTCTDAAAYAETRFYRATIP